MGRQAVAHLKRGPSRWQGRVILVVLLGSTVPGGLGAWPAPPPPLSARQGLMVKERDRLLREGNAAFEANNRRRGAALYWRALDIERMIQGALGPRWKAVLEGLAHLGEQEEDFR